MLGQEARHDYGSGPVEGWEKMMEKIVLPKLDYQGDRYMRHTNFLTASTHIPCIYYPCSFGCFSRIICSIVCV